MSRCASRRMTQLVRSINGSGTGQNRAQMTHIPSASATQLLHLATSVVSMTEYDTTAMQSLVLLTRNLVTRGGDQAQRGSRPPRPTQRRSDVACSTAVEFACQRR